MRRPLAVLGFLCLVTAPLAACDSDEGTTTDTIEDVGDVSDAVETDATPDDASTADSASADTGGASDTVTPVDVALPDTVDADTSEDEDTADADTSEDEDTADADTGDDTVQADTDDGDDTVQADTDDGDDAVQADTDDGDDTVQADTDDGDDTVQADTDDGDDTVQADTDEGDTVEVCGPVTDFSDDFERADADDLGGCWIAYPALVAAASIDGGAACGDEQSLGVMSVAEATTTVSYDWVAAAESGLETHAIAAVDPGDGVNSAIIAGIDGGSTPPELKIKTFGGTVLAGPSGLGITAGTTYRLTATFDPSGSVSVSVTSGGVDVSGSPLSATVSGGFSMNLAGFIVGRDDDGDLTCVDDVSITQ